MTDIQNKTSEISLRLPLNSIVFWSIEGKTKFFRMLHSRTRLKPEMVHPRASGEEWFVPNGNRWRDENSWQSSVIISKNLWIPRDYDVDFNREAESDSSIDSTSSTIQKSFRFGIVKIMQYATIYFEFKALPCFDGPTISIHREFQCLIIANSSLINNMSQRCFLNSKSGVSRFNRDWREFHT
jgi:hypothetical protein